ncbi:MAG: Addiction module toxin, RelE/StbE family [Candidatus Woesebacteria bacterium GW2011_GWB1_43_14]|uniref:Addiction module toxin, RelE/StbE family n=1 Tax=Candidatus Woesebacteria bacterium GW2011_GWB1_43_14 TaxID=1618578 RepID=A0A0G1FVI8_9BACT|nr:MAG: Addiction module toxin, RelE/StbE family [Candidatus Woesebacteria bacterium GW2011_GWA1_39_11b]KKS78274.1 MAG: RelE-like protein [Candidatus Woesebacteria bacterium GW2011_GWC1_42_9]KKS99011.1 MAG: Addiction module toxin, RelE/StbE family [Candidatus Woesebacteria bacterium GW2011_GWB1_43_14]
MKLYLSLKAKKQLGKLPTSERRKIEKKFLNLSQDPFLGKKLSGEFKDCWSLKAWPYRVIYVVDIKKKSVFISSILHRQGAYN